MRVKKCRITVSDGRWTLKKSDRDCSGGGYGGSRSDPAPEITQSRRTGNDNPASPQVNHNVNSVFSVPTAEKVTDPLQKKGSSFQQIYQTEHFIFKLSTSLEELSRYRFDPNTGESIEMNAFRRVKDISFPGMFRFRIRGTPTEFQSKRYALYGLMLQGCLQGYMLSSGQKSKALFFIPKEKRR